MYSILIIEDEQRVADLLRVGLEENGYNCLVAYDGAMGLRMFRANTFDLVISDIVLPKMDGFELCKEIRAANPAIPILMLTALGSTDDKPIQFVVRTAQCGEHWAVRTTNWMGLMPERMITW